ncbi:MAG TPA: cohesin domain-containing protein, partial [Patescibacteria group bacterium]|nr:cohesin domain-containing protein [Patescibacteria group bacterium]
MKNICKVLSFAFVMLLSLQMLLTLAPAHAVSTTMEIVNPLDGTHNFNFTIAQKSINDTFAVNLTINNVQELASWQARITWDPALLEYVSIMRVPDDIFSNIPLGAGVLTAGPDPTPPGSVLYGAAVLPPTGNQWTFNGTGRLAVLTLKIIKGVTSGGLRQVHCDVFFDSLGVDTFILNGQGTDIPFTPVNGYYSYTAPPPPPANLCMNPPKVVNPALVAGSEFNVTLNIANATSVGSWSANILYDNSILNATDVVEGDFLMTINTTTFTFTIVQDYNATHGMIQISCLLSSGGANGDGILSTVTFNVLALGQSAITINDANLLDEFGLPLPFSTSSGYFNNILVAKLSIDPDMVTGPSYIPGTTFTINVTLSDVENLKTCLFNLTYAPLVIQEITITVSSILGETPIKKLQVDDAAGYIWANLTYRNGITTYSPVTA